MIKMGLFDIKVRNIGRNNSIEDCEDFKYVEVLPEHKTELIQEDHYLSMEEFGFVNISGLNDLQCDIKFNGYGLISTKDLTDTFHYKESGDYVLCTTPQHFPIRHIKFKKLRFEKVPNIFEEEQELGLRYSSDIYTYRLSKTIVFSGEIFKKIYFIEDMVALTSNLFQAKKNNNIETSEKYNIEQLKLIESICMFFYYMGKNEFYYDDEIGKRFQVFFSNEYQISIFDFITTNYKPTKSMTYFLEVLQYYYNMLQIATYVEQILKENYLTISMDYKIQSKDKNIPIDPIIMNFKAPSER
jgi:hypothetical protein